MGEWDIQIAQTFAVTNNCRNMFYWQWSIYASDDGIPKTKNGSTWNKEWVFAEIPVQLINSQHKSGFIGFMVCILALIFLYKTNVLK